MNRSFSARARDPNPLLQVTCLADCMGLAWHGHVQDLWPDLSRVAPVRGKMLIEMRTPRRLAQAIRADGSALIHILRHGSFWGAAPGARTCPRVTDGTARRSAKSRFC